VKVQENKEFWEKHLKAFQNSGMSQRVYCRAHNLKHRSLQYHLHKNGLTGNVKTCGPARQNEWIPVTVVDEPAPRTTGGVRIQISRITIEADRRFDDARLANLLRAVEAVC
jgi:hypothetical protein